MNVEKTSRLASAGSPERKEDNGLEPTLGKAWVARYCLTFRSSVRSLWK